jgi:hypothetical protein
MPKKDDRVGELYPLYISSDHVVVTLVTQTFRGFVGLKLPEARDTAEYENKRGAFLVKEFVAPK